MLYRTHVDGGGHMERVLIGLLVLVFMLGTMYVAARLAVRRPGATWQDPEPPQAVHPTRTSPEPGELARLAESALTSMFD